MTPDKLKAARFNMKLTQKELSDRLNISKRMLQFYEAGRFSIPRTFEYAVYWLMISEKLKKVFLKRFFSLTKTK